MKPEDRDDCFVTMGFSDGQEHLKFWCPMYNPYRVRYPKNQYDKGEEICFGCCLPDRGVMYRAMFQCTRVASPMLLTGYAYERGNRFWNISHGVPRGDEARLLTDMMEWLNGRETKAKRKSTKKTSNASKERDDIHRADHGAPAGLVQDNPVGAKVKIPEKEIGEQKVEQGDDHGCECEGGLQGLRGGVPLREEIVGLPQTVDSSPVQPVRSESAVPDNQGCEVGVLPGLQGNEKRESPVIDTTPFIDTSSNGGGLRAIFEPAMRVEYDESYKQTTAHSCITCKCGTKVWYGCGKKQKSRPKYCRACTEIETHKLLDNFSNLDPEEIEELLEEALRREIIR